MAAEEERKKLQVTERLQKREEERLQNIQHRKVLKEDETVLHETTDYVMNQLSVINSKIEKALSSYCSETHGASGKYFDDLVVDLQKAQKILTDSARVLSPYLMEKSQATINQLKAAIEDKRSQVQPKRKFAFKSDRKKTTVQTSAEMHTDNNSASIDAKASVSRPDQQPIVMASESGFTNRNGEVLTLSSADVDKKDVVLSSLTGCRVTICGCPSTVHITSVRDCTILCGPTSGSVFVDDCQKSVCVVACQQLRVHRTSNTRFYLHVTSRAIIEDCSAIEFAPYNWTYEHIDEDFRKAGIDRTRNNWNAIDDFNWLAADKPSPNWSVVNDTGIASWSEDGAAS